MLYGVKVRVDTARLLEFGSKLQSGALDRSLIRSETYCLADDPAVGYSVWEAEDAARFEAAFAPWRPYYGEVEVRPLVTPAKAFQLLLADRER